MERIVEPELMDDRWQAEAYAAADFSEADNLFLQVFTEAFPGETLAGLVLDLGCGPGNITFGFAKRFAECNVVGIDGSAPMLQIAKQRLQTDLLNKPQIQFIQGLIAAVALPAGPYSAIVSNSLLHHLHRPEMLWEFISHHAESGCKILVMDLFRPESPSEAQSFVDKYAATEPDVLQRDFYNSLLAAFTPDEVRQQLTAAGLAELEVAQVSDRHMIIIGEKC